MWYSMKITAGSDNTIMRLCITNHAKRSSYGGLPVEHRSLSRCNNVGTTMLLPRHSRGCKFHPGDHCSPHMYKNGTRVRISKSVGQSNLMSINFEFRNSKIVWALKVHTFRNSENHLRRWWPIKLLSLSSYPFSRTERLRENRKHRWVFLNDTLLLMQDMSSDQPFH